VKPGAREAETVHLLTAEEMRRIDRHAIDEIGIPSLVLMENAGRGVAEEVAALAPRIGKRWLVMAGKGNNGADGVVAARHLANAGFQVAVVYAAEPDILTGEAAVQRDIARRLEIPLTAYSEGGVDWRDWDGVIDALLGTGAGGAPRGVTAEMIRVLNASGKPVVAVDIPSGLDADTGQVHDPCVRAVKTVTFAFKKRGLAQYPGLSYAGEVAVRDIGIPAAVADKFGVSVFELDEDVFRGRLGVDPELERDPAAHKGSCGHALVAAGSRAYSGAGLLAASAALMAGSGLVTWAAPAGVMPPLLTDRPELILARLDDGGRGDWSGVDPAHVLELARGKQALVIGPGFGRWKGDFAWLREVMEQAEMPLVADADALNILAEGAAAGEWPRRKAPTVITPHPGEMARLCGTGTAEVQRDRIGIARRFAMERDVVVVLKGARTVIALPGGEAYVNPTGNPAMATAGTGDVLAGVIGALLAQGLTAAQAAALGAYRHGAAGDRAAAKRNARHLVAGDLLEEL